MADHLHELQKNADRFSGFAAAYHEVRPKCPPYVRELVRRYLGRSPQVVVDLGCGTGLSTFGWCGEAKQVIGVEPNPEMMLTARQAAEKQGLQNVEFGQGFSDGTGLPDECADAAVCSQSFHWMEPAATLREVSRILKPGGVFLTVDCDWPPVVGWQAEAAYQTLFEKVRAIEEGDPDIRKTFTRYPKERHLHNIRESGRFCYVREIVFTSREQGSASRFIGLALSQGSLQAILKRKPEQIIPDLEAFERAVRAVMGENAPADFDFCYRCRIGIKE